MKTAGLLPFAVVLWAAGPAPAGACKCPVLIEEAEGLAER